VSCMVVHGSELARARVHGNASPLCVRWAARSGRNDVARVGCTVGLGVFCLGESILCVETSLAAR
jgi:hypothetical protein